MFKKIIKSVGTFIGKVVHKIGGWIHKEVEVSGEIKNRNQTAADEAFLKTNRNEVDGALQVFFGKLPDDLHGVFYTVYPVGSVNSNGLPFPEKINGEYNKEFASPIMNGDGMIVSVNFNTPNAPAIRSRILKTPCYFADLNSKRDTNDHNSFGFYNYGITRMSLLLGSRNELNTAAIPVRFKDAPAFLLSTYDVGRPFVTDPVSLTLQSPVGNHADWTPGTPSELPWPFAMVCTTAHPSFDANTQELFTVNYTKTHKGKTYVCHPKTIYHLQNNPDIFKSKLHDLCNELVDETDSNVVQTRLNDFFENLDYHIDGTAPTETTDNEEEQHGSSTWLIRWKGKELERWNLLDQDGNLLLIEECTHQMALTKDYIIITDCSFKFSIDLLVNNPFPDDPLIDSVIRKFLAGVMLPYTDCYIIKRAELTEGASSATAYKLQQPIPLETIHYSCDYENPDGKITLYGIHNTAACVAEWIRNYDLSHLSQQPVATEMISLFALGSMDLNRIGKWVIDVNTLQIDNTLSKQYYDTGKTSEIDMGPNTWTLGLYTFRDIISPVKTVSKINYIWFVANGLDSRMLTQFIFNLYKDYPNRIVPVDKVVDYTNQDLPQTLVRLNCDTMQPDDHFQFMHNVYIRSLHFIPRKKPSANISPDLDGYLFCTVQSGIPQIGPVSYRSEYWIFDAAKLSAGAICKLKFDDLQFCFTLHTAWLEEAMPLSFDYNVDVQTDYDEVINKQIDHELTAKFFKEHVYPDWYAQKAG